MKNLKKIIVVVLMMIAFLPTKEVDATAFRAADFVNIYRNKEKEGVVISSRRERMIRDNKTGEITYCIEPYGALIDNYEYPSEYSSYSTDLNMTEEEYERIQLLAYYGYNYETHTNPEWYSITQIMIWRTIDKLSNFYWVEFPYKAKIDVYESEIEELERLVQTHSKRPIITGLSGKKLSINNEYRFEIDNDILANYNLIGSNENVQLIGNNLIINYKDSGEKYIELEEKVENYNDIAKMYISNDSQDLIKVGKYQKKNIIIPFSVNSGSIKIKKIDRDTKTTTSSGEASLVGAVYELYDKENNLIDELIIGEDSLAKKEDLPFGNYKLKEIQSGKGYYINNKIYEFEINEENLNIEIEVENEVISTKVVLHKYYGNESSWNNESDITFNVYDGNGLLYKEIKTNHDGVVEIRLPYGKYKFSQINTTDNYQIVNSFELIINETTGEIVNCDLYDLEIETPNTTTEKSIIIKIPYFKRKEYD